MWAYVAKKNYLGKFNFEYFSCIQIIKTNKMYMVFWWKNLDLDSNLYNLKKRIKIAS